MKRLIVGFDPGTTVGIGVLDLSGNVLFFSSFRNFSFEDVVRKLGEFGKPIIVASDVSPAPESVRKLAASFDAEIFEPELSLTVEEKTRLANAKGVKDAHQRDSLAAALKAEESYRSLIRRAKKVGDRWDLAFELALKGKAPNLSKVFTEVEPVGEEKFSLPLGLKLKIAMKENKRLREIVNTLMRSLDSVRKTEGKRPFATPRARSVEIDSVLARAEAAEKAGEAFERLLRHFGGKEVVILESGAEGDVVFVPVFDRAAESALKAKIVVAGKIFDSSERFEVVPLGALDGFAVGDFAVIPSEKFPKVGKEWLKKFVGSYKNRKEKS